MNMLLLSMTNLSFKFVLNYRYNYVLTFSTHEMTPPPPSTNNSESLAGLYLSSLSSLLESKVGCTLVNNLNRLSNGVLRFEK